MSTKIPPPPPGYVLDDDIPPPPPGFVLDSPVQPAKSRPSGGRGAISYRRPGPGRSAPTREMIARPLPTLPAPWPQTDQGKAIAEALFGISRPSPPVDGMSVREQVATGLPMRPRLPPRRPIATDDEGDILQTKVSQGFHSAGAGLNRLIGTVADAVGLDPLADQQLEQARLRRG